MRYTASREIDAVVRTTPSKLLLLFNLSVFYLYRATSVVLSSTPHFAHAQPLSGCS